MAAWLLAAGEKGKRYATPISRILLHQARLQMSGTTSDVRIAAEKIMDIGKND